MAYKFNPFTAKLDEYGPILTGTGTVSAAADGTAALPGIAFAADLNTGIYRPGADQVAISTGGAGRLFVDASGRLGVGTSSPSDTLQINKTGAGGVKVVSTTQSTITFSNSTETGGYIIGRSIGSDNAHNLFFYDLTNSHYVDYFEGGSGGYRSFYTNGSERLRIDSSGRVGIGTSLPETSLHVSGITRVTSGADGGAYQLRYSGANASSRTWRLINDANAYGDLDIQQSTTQTGSTFASRLYINASGQVGIGTTSPSNNLDVVGSTTSVVRIQGGSSGSDTNRRATLELLASGSKLYKLTASAADGSLQFLDDTTERARIDSSGRLGIGTSSPAAKLHITDATGTAVELLRLETGWNSPSGNKSITWADGTNVLGRISVDYTAPAAAMRFGSLFNSGYQTSDLMTLTPTGLGIGTASPVAPLHVSGSAVFARLTDTQAYSFGTSGPVLDLTGNDSSGANTLFVRVQGSPANGGPDRGFLNVLTRLNGVNTSTLQVGTGFTADVLVPNGRLGIGTTSPDAPLHVNTTGGEGIRVTTASGQAGNIALLAVTGVSNGYQITNDVSNNINHIWNNANGERARIDSSGRLLVGTSSSTAEAKFIVQGGATGSGGWMSIQRNATTASAGSTIGVIDFTNSSNNVGARVIAEGDGTWSAGTSHPTRLVFSTTADGESSPTERMRIKNNGTINFSNVAVYADNAAATTGGLAVGDVYRTSTGQLMIRY